MSNVSLEKELLEEAMKLYNNGDYYQAYKTFEEIAKEGNAIAKYYIYKIGDNYRFRCIIDLEQGLKYLTEAGESGLLDACKLLGQIYEYGVTSFSRGLRRIDVDYNKALYWFLKAYEAGDLSDLHNAGICCFKINNIEEGKKYFEECVSKNYLPSIMTYAKYLMKGNYVEADYDKSFILYEKAASLKSNDGMFFVGKCYEEGLGVKKDLNKAFELYSNSNTRGAYYRLANFYEQGIIVNKDYYKAVEYLYKGSNMSFDQTEEDISSKLIEYGSGEDQEKLIALRKYQKEHNI